MSQQPPTTPEAFLKEVSETFEQIIETDQMSAGYISFRSNHSNAITKLFTKFEPLMFGEKRHIEDALLRFTILLLLFPPYPTEEHKQLETLQGLSNDFELVNFILHIHNNDTLKKKCKEFMIIVDNWSAADYNINVLLNMTNMLAKELLDVSLRSKFALPLSLSYERFLTSIIENEKMSFKEWLMYKKEREQQQQQRLQQQQEQQQRLQQQQQPQRKGFFSISKGGNNPKPPTIDSYKNDVKVIIVGEFLLTMFEHLRKNFESDYKTYKAKQQQQQQPNGGKGKKQQKTVTTRRPKTKS
jgi:hypothetical protein